MPAKPPAFFDGFNLPRFLLKAGGSFMALLGVISAFSDFSQGVSDWRDAVKANQTSVFVGFAVWMIGMLAIELIRLELRYTTAMYRYRRRHPQKAKRGKR